MAEFAAARPREPANVAATVAVVTTKPIVRNIDSYEQHRKTKAIKAAANAVRPCSAITGLGEKSALPAAQQLGAKFSNKMVIQEPQQGTGRTHTAYAAADRVARDIWPQDIQQKSPRYCVGCRGEHQRANEHNQSWQPYTPLQRYKNLGILDSKFQTAFKQGKLHISLTGAEPVRWLGVTPQGKAMKPVNLEEQQYKELLPLLFEGIREGHEPYRYLASQAALELLAVAAHTTPTTTTQGETSKMKGGKQQSPQAQWLLDILPEVVTAAKAGLNTLQPALAAYTLLMLQQLLRTNRAVGPAMVPLYHQLLPAMMLLMTHSRTNKAGFSNRMLLPPPQCLPPVGSFTGRPGHEPQAGSPTCCTVCGVRFGDAPQIKHQRKQEEQEQHRAQHPQEGVCGNVLRYESSSRPPLFGGEVPAVSSRGATRQRRATMLEIVEETIQLMVEVGGTPALAAVKHYCPTFEYCNPQD